MDLQKMELVGLNVRDIDAAMDVFSRLLGVEFVRFDFTDETPIGRFSVDGDDQGALSPRGTIVAMDRTGYIELIQTDPPTEDEGLRNIHFKVSDIDAAVEDLRSRGFRIVANMRIGKLREAVLDPTDLHGVRLCLVEYDAPSMIEAMTDFDTP